MSSKSVKPPSVIRQPLKPRKCENIKVTKIVKSTRYAQVLAEMPELEEISPITPNVLLNQEESKFHFGKVK